MPRLIPVLAVALLVAVPLQAQSGAYRAAPSTRATAEVQLMLADTAAQRAAGKPALIRVDYGQPHLRGRTIDTEGLVPMGDVWRLGANAATLLTTDVNLTIGGKAVPKGRYIAQMLREASGWTLILQAETSGAEAVMLSAYDASKDAARIPMSASTLSSPMESLMIALVPSTAAGQQRGTLNVAWGTALLSAEWVVE